MMASWNVVSVYSNVGTDFPELHKSIVELKSVLQDFEESFGAKVARTDPKPRRDFAPPSQDRKDDVNGDQDAQDTPDRMQHDGPEDSSAAPGNSSGNMPQQQDNIDIDSQSEEPKPERTQLDMPPPRTVQMSQRHQNDEAEGDQRGVRHQSAIPSTHRFPPNRASASPAPSVTKRKREPSTESSNSNSKSNFELERRRDELRNTPSKHASPTLLPLLFPTQDPLSQLFPSAPSSTHSDEEDDRIPPTKPKSLKEMSSKELKAAYTKRKDELLATFGGNVNVPQQYRVQMQNLRKEIMERMVEETRQHEDGGDKGDGGWCGGSDEEKRVPGRGGASEKKLDGGGGNGVAMPKFLGDSVLGGKKPTDMAPIAPMMHTRKPSGGSNGSNGSPGGKKRN
jgi:hypothetical protein